MAKITYITSDNQTHTVEVQNGLTVMEGAVQNDIPGIDADCGGGMACATCHVYVKDDWFNRIPKKEDGEDDMLDMAFEPKTNSRLSCQIIVSDELDGLEVKCYGNIILNPRGKSGFGYDPIFEESSTRLTFAEMNNDIKDSCSHRGKALKKIIPDLIEIFS